MSRASITYVQLSTCLQQASLAHFHKHTSRKGAHALSVLTHCACARRQRGLGRRLLIKCHEIVTADWAGEIRKLTPAERLDYDIERIFLKVDAENAAAVNLYKRLGYKEVVKVAEELMVPKSSTDVQEWPVLNVYMQRDAQFFNPFRAFPKRR